MKNYFIDFFINRLRMHVYLLRSMRKYQREILFDTHTYTQRAKLNIYFSSIAIASDMRIFLYPNASTENYL